ncbi:hypothetical protein IWW50_004407 [Coemansia erecta]|nr:hypothetical protein GGF43_003738 [Coemansia sp. RSA 2618]KAJ2821998.1 hypothetical protein IWW50_004407 [Coemansia erecta]
MSFKFNFGVDEDGDCMPGTAETIESGIEAMSCCEDEGAAESVAPYECIPLSIPLVSSIVVDAIYCRSQRLWKRQIDDVQFQLAQQDQMDDSTASAVRQAMSTGSTAADVIKNEYEGGLKTWECSMDLLGYLIDHQHELFAASDRSFRVMDIGCGTALPSLYLLANVPNAKLCLQDYNKDVIELITIPNVLANTALAPSDSTSGDALHSNSDTESCDIDVDFRRTQVLFGDETDKIIGAREVPELTSEEAHEADVRLLQGTDIHERCEFVSGDWANFDKEVRAQGREHTFDLVLTSETIYDTASYKRLHDLVACVLAKPVEEGVQQPMALVAAKTIYFGLSGSVLSFEQYVRGRGVFDIESIWQSGDSMSREILRMTWRST